MELAAGGVPRGKLNFGHGSLILHRKIRRPISEKVLRHFPKIATALGSRGREAGRLAAVMTASGSIDYVGKDKKSFQFYIRPMS